MKKHLKILFTLILAFALLASIGTGALAAGISLVTIVPTQATNGWNITYTILSTDIQSGTAYTLELWQSTTSSMTNGTCVYSGSATGLTGTIFYDTSNTASGTYYLYVKVTANDHAATSNPISITVVSAGTVEVTPTATPSTELVITKSPSGETLDAGGDAYFIASADNYSKVEWRIVNKDQTVCYRGQQEIEAQFPGISFNAWTSEDGREYLHLMTIPKELDGYCIQAKFWSKDGNDTAFTDIADAEITVNEVTATPVPSAAPTVTPEPTATPVQETAAPAVTDSPATPTATPASDKETVSAKRQTTTIALGISALGLVTIGCGIYLVFHKNKDNE